MFFALVYATTILVGLVSAGLIRSSWELATGETPHYTLWGERTAAQFLNSVVGIAVAPLQLVLAARQHLSQRPIRAIIYATLGFAWGFVQGVFILTQFFGLT